MVDSRARLLRAALAAVLVRDPARELDLVHHSLDTWAGLGLVVAGMTHQGFGRTTDGLRRAGLARELLPGRHRALRRRRQRVGRRGGRHPVMAGSEKLFLTAYDACHMDQD